ncbi:DUF2512 family protein [Pontibacillus yanchengensis]|uniref:DUF2512 family protein n=2 Tax=Pontibacillus yanchengensis TaxID=462910 RepID=A0A6I4ZX52_9BACI|nr:DUF2512 family protein [Pontibacillus yanchengensis]MYL34755.1 DUF2512 family protein [Pontibacillus yanchengensis]MYL52259.1 DUF2512 family protein [Pontibacillus yanchengensis]
MQKIILEVLKLKHLKALGLKWVILITALYPIYGAITNASLGNIFLISIVLLGITYVVGDLFILRRYGLIVTSIVDFVIPFGILYLFGQMINGIPTQTVLPAIAASSFIVAFETFFHIYMEDRVLELGPKVYERRRQLLVPKKLRVESSEELFPYEAQRKDAQKEETHDPEKE